MKSARPDLLNVWPVRLVSTPLAVCPRLRTDVILNMRFVAARTVATLTPSCLITIEIIHINPFVARDVEISREYAVTSTAYSHLCTFARSPVTPIPTVHAPYTHNLPDPGKPQTACSNDAPVIFQHKNLSWRACSLVTSQCAASLGVWTSGRVNCFA